MDVKTNRSTNPGERKSLRHKKSEIVHVGFPAPHKKAIMKKLIGILFLFITVSVFAQNPQLNNGSVTFESNAQNVYYVDYSQFVFPITVYPMGWGVGYIDLNTRTRPLDSYVDGDGFECSAWYSSTWLKVEPEAIGLPGTESRFTITYYVTDVNGNASNIGRLGVRILWTDTID